MIPVILTMVLVALLFFIVGVAVGVTAKSLSLAQEVAQQRRDHW